MTAALRTEGLSKQFGAFRAVSEVTLAFPHGARHALIGPNGAGKTTLINLLTGVLPPTSGETYLGDERITGLPPHERVKRVRHLRPDIVLVSGGIDGGAVAGVVVAAGMNELSVGMRLSPASSSSSLSSARVPPSCGTRSAAERLRVRIEGVFVRVRARPSAI